MLLVEATVATLLFPVIAFLSFFWYRKKKRGGREIAAIAPEQQADQLSLFRGFKVTTSKKWCRVRATCRYTNAAKRNEPSVHRYTLSLLDERGTELFSEQRYLSDFLSFFWHASHADKGHDIFSFTCDAVVLEFIPPWPGTYTLGFTMKTREKASEIGELKLHISEGVWPQRKKPYVHTCVDLRKRAAVA